MKASLILLHTMILFGLTNLSAQSDSKTVNILLEIMEFYQENSVLLPIHRVIQVMMFLPILFFPGSQKN